jgi:hypothetical protein
MEPFTDIPGGPAPARLAPLGGGLAADAEQSGDRLVVTVVLANNGDEDLRLLNPLDTLRFDVRDEGGHARAVPQAPPSSLVHVAGGAPGWTAAASTVPLVAVRRDGEVVSTGALDGETVALPAHRRWDVTFAIDRIAAPGNSPAGGGYAAPAAGTYTVASIVTAIDAGERDQARILHTAPVDIRLTRPR